MPETKTVSKNKLFSKNLFLKTLLRPARVMAGGGQWERSLRGAKKLEPPGRKAAPSGSGTGDRDLKATIRAWRRGLMGHRTGWNRAGRNLQGRNPCLEAE